MVSEAAGPVFEFGPFRFESGNHLLLRGTEPIQLAPKAIDTLHVLLEHRGRVVSKDELIERLWPDTSVESANLTQNVYLLRKALGEGPHDQNYIETIPKRGYRFVATVTVKHAPDAPVDEGDVAAPASDQRTLGNPRPAGTVREPVPVSVRLSNPAALVSGTLTIALLSALIYGAVRTRPGHPDTVQRVRAIAVLPFKPIGLQPRDEVLELGMADTLITKLGGIRQVVVRPTSNVRRYGGLDQDPLEAGREQRADLVLEGSIQRLDERIRVTVRLLDVRDGTALLGESLDEPLTDVFAAQDSIASHVVQALVLKLGDDERALLTKHRAMNPEAYRLYLRGRYFWDKRTTEGFQKAVASFRDALEQDPSSALPYVGLADAYIALPFDTDALPSDALGKAKAAATRALEIDDTLAEAHAALGFVNETYEWDWAGAEHEFKRALDLSPNSAMAHQRYANLMTVMGRHAEATAETTRTLELDPVSLAATALAGRMYYYAREYDHALEQCQKALDLDAHFWIAHFFAGKAYAQKGMYAEALAELGKAEGATTEVLATIGYVDALARDAPAARAVLDRLTRQRSQTYVPPSHLAKIHAALGENDQAFVWLDKACEEHDAWLIWLSSEPMWDPLRADPRFSDLLRRLGLPSTAPHRM
jgi:DNA-binding winged helix-turn-helix (wHTH) protein/TolB-like protein/Flp pilus assembly protein TadD